MANYFEITRRAMRNRLKLMGWEYDREEAQQLTVKKGIRDYSKIQLSKKKRLLQMLKGSNIESYIRHKINLDLTEILPECEIIVGINNISILGSREVDIPIIIIDKENTYKFAIEVNGSYWHEDKDTEDFKKEKDLNRIKYNVYQIIQFNSTKLQTEYGEIDEQVFKIIKNIKDKITQKTA